MICERCEVEWCHRAALTCFVCGRAGTMDLLPGPPWANEFADITPETRARIAARASAERARLYETILAGMFVVRELRSGADSALIWADEVAT